jgi:hypothetical protein
MLSDSRVIGHTGVGEDARRPGHISLADDSLGEEKSTQSFFVFLLWIGVKMTRLCRAAATAGNFVRLYL